MGTNFAHKTEFKGGFMTEISCMSVKTRVQALRSFTYLRSWYFVGVYGGLYWLRGVAARDPH